MIPYTKRRRSRPLASTFPSWCLDFAGAQALGPCACLASSCIPARLVPLPEPPSSVLGQRQGLMQLDPTGSGCMPTPSAPTQLWTPWVLGTPSTLLSSLPSAGVSCAFGGGAHFPYSRAVGSKHVAQGSTLRHRCRWEGWAVGRLGQGPPELQHSPTPLDLKRVGGGLPPQCPIAPLYVPLPRATPHPHSAFSLPRRACSLCLFLSFFLSSSISSWGMRLTPTVVAFLFLSCGHLGSLWCCIL